MRYTVKIDDDLISDKDMLKQISLICPSDKSSGHRQKYFVYDRPTSFWADPDFFLNGTNRGARIDTWNNLSPYGSPVVLCEYEPYHDLSKEIGFEPDKWKGRFLNLHAN